MERNAGKGELVGSLLVEAVKRRGHEGAAPGLTSLEETGQRSYDSAVSRFNAWNKARPITERTFADYFEGLKAGTVRRFNGEAYAPASVAHQKAALKASVKASAGNRLTVRFAAELDTLFRSVRVRVDRKVYPEEVLSPSEVRELVEETPERIGSLVRFLYASGLRISEAVTLRLADCRVSGRLVRVRVRFGKGSKEREVKVPRAVFDAVREAYGNESPFLFPNRRGGHLSRQYAHREIRFHGLRVLGREVGCHTLRHSHATNLLKSGASLKAVSQNLGHARTETTSRFYIHDHLTDEAVLSLDVAEDQ